MSKPCKNCSKEFTIFPEDRAFYERIDVPEPTWCPLCRHIRRHGHINDYVFYWRGCDGCKKNFVSILSPKSDYKVFCPTCWFSEKRDDTAEGRPYKDNISFFEQFDALMRSAPQLGIIGMNNQNSDYCESVANCKNTYLISESSNCEDCSYCYWIQKTKDSLDCSYTHECERCYGAVDCTNCYGLRYSQNCNNCSDSAFLEDCTSCRHCLFCTNLRQREYCIFNKQYTKDAYEKECHKLDLGDIRTVELLQAKFAEFLVTQPRRALHIEHTENCSGNYIHHAKNCRDVYHCYEAEDCAYGEHVWRGAKDCMDSNTAGRDAELLYETTNTGIGSYNVKFSRYCWGSKDMEYCNQCMQCRDLFGCVSLKPGARFCVFNKQYSESEYRDLVVKIKKNMRSSGEYGEFFPLSLSLFGFNNSTSFDTFPLSKEEVLGKGWKWEDQESGTIGKGTVEMQTLPKSIQDVPGTLCKEVLTCTACKRNYNITQHELTFYKKEHIPIPRSCPTCRHRYRLAIRAPRETFLRPCAQCKKEIRTTYSLERPEIVYCDTCYLGMVY